MGNYFPGGQKDFQRSAEHFGAWPVLGMPNVNSVVNRLVWVIGGFMAALD